MSGELFFVLLAAIFSAPHTTKEVGERLAATSLILSVAAFVGGLVVRFL